MERTFSNLKQPGEFSKNWVEAVLLAIRILNIPNFKQIFNWSLYRTSQQEMMEEVELNPKKKDEKEEDALEYYTDKLYAVRCCLVF